PARSLPASRPSRSRPRARRLRACAGTAGTRALSPTPAPAPRWARESARSPRPSRTAGTGAGCAGRALRPPLHRDAPGHPAARGRARDRRQMPLARLLFLVRLLALLAEGHGVLRRRLQRGGLRLGRGSFVLGLGALLCGAAVLRNCRLGRLACFGFVRTSPGGIDEDDGFPVDHLAVIAGREFGHLTGIVSDPTTAVSRLLLRARSRGSNARISSSYDSRAEPL